MTPPIFNLDDEVEITGQNVHNNSLRLGQRFVIEQIIIDKKYGTMYSAPGQLGFPSSSLRLVEELKIGDLVKILGPDCVGIMRSHDPGRAYPIHTKTDSGNFQIWGIGFYPAPSLRKLTPEEIQQHLTPPNKVDLDEIEAKFRLDERLSAIEKSLRVPDHRYDGLRKRVEELEACQIGEMPEVTDRVEPDRRVRITITKGDCAEEEAFYNVFIAKHWCERVLDSMKEA